jgi:hypothetical protein
LRLEPIRAGPMGKPRWAGVETGWVWFIIKLEVLEDGDELRWVLIGFQLRYRVVQVESSIEVCTRKESCGEN